MAEARLEIKKRLNKKILMSTFLFIIVLFAVPFALNVYIKNYSDQFLLDRENLKEYKGECIIILGAGLKKDGTPNSMLKDRLDMGISLYYEGKASKLLLSGDNGQVEYDEVNSMKEYALTKGIPLEDIFMDHAGFSTYESMYRAKEIFGVNKAIVVTQKYHQYRSIYLGKKLGIDIVGISAQEVKYSGQNYRNLRESIARVKDYVKVIIKPLPTYLGEKISISGDGTVSHD